MKKFRKLLTICLAAVALLVMASIIAPATDVKAADYQRDEEYLKANFNSLKNYITKNGYANEEGDMYIQTQSGNIIIAAVYVADQDYIRFAYTESPDVALYMDLNSVEVKDVKFTDQETKEAYYNGGKSYGPITYVASIRIKIKDYSPSVNYYFAVESDQNTGAFTDEPSLIQEGANATLRKAVSAWNELISSEAGITLPQIGFTALCTGHSFNDITVKEATCTEKGQIKRRCSSCGSYELADTDCLAHTYDDWTVTKAATCGAAGSQKRTCSVCGYTETQAIPATGNHTYGAWVNVQAADVFVQGIFSRTCSVCGKTETINSAKLDPTIVLSKNKVKLKRKKSYTLKVAYTDGDSIVSFKTSNKKVATVNAKGKIVAKKKGKATITVTLKSGKKAKCKVTVK